MTRAVRQALEAIDVAGRQWASSAEELTRSAQLATSHLRAEVDQELRQRTQRAKAIEAQLSVARDEEHAQLKRQLKRTREGIETVQHALREVSELEARTQHLQRRVAAAASERIPKLSSQIRMMHDALDRFESAAVTAGHVLGEAVVTAVTVVNMGHAALDLVQPPALAQASSGNSIVLQVPQEKSIQDIAGAANDHAIEEGLEMLEKPLTDTLEREGADRGNAQSPRDV